MRASSSAGVMLAETKADDSLLGTGDGGAEDAEEPPDRAGPTDGDREEIENESSSSTGETDDDDDDDDGDRSGSPEAGDCGGEWASATP